MRAEANGFIDGLLKYGTVLITQIFPYIFDYTTPLSEYLQTRGVVILGVQCLVEGFLEERL